MAETWSDLRRSDGEWAGNHGMYGLLAHGPMDMANAFLNQRRTGSSGGYAESFPSYQRRTGKGNAERGWWGRPRVPVRCTWPLAACPGAPVCTALHVDADALDAAQVAA